MPARLAAAARLSCAPRITSTTAVAPPTTAPATITTSTTAPNTAPLARNATDRHGHADPRYPRLLSACHTVMAITVEGGWGRT